MLDRADVTINEKCEYLKKQLIGESKRLQLPDPSNFVYVPKDHINEIVDNCFLGDA